MTKSISDYKACIFDLDGTLLNSMGVWKQVDEKFLGKRRLPLTDEYLKAISVMKLDLAAKYTVKLFNLNESPEDIIKEWLDLARYEFTYNIQPKPYGVEYVRLLKEKISPPPLPQAAKGSCTSLHCSGWGYLICLMLFSTRIKQIAARISPTSLLKLPKALIQLRGTAWFSKIRQPEFYPPKMRGLSLLDF